jgi:urease accessory protein
MPYSLPEKKVQAVRDDPNWHWQADLTLVFSQIKKRGTRLTRNRHRGPLYVQKPFYPEGADVAHVYLLHPPGGLVSGDTLTLNIELEEFAKGLVTTPGATRMYKARKKSPVQRQQTTLVLKENATLEWFPMEAIVYNQAHAELETKIILNDSSSIFAWEITCFGLPARGEKFELGYFKQRYRIEKNNKPLFIDNLIVDKLDVDKLDSSNKNKEQFFSSNAGMQKKTVSGFFIAGPFENNDYSKRRDILTEQLRDVLVKENFEKTISITWVNDFCITRYLGDSAFQARKGFTLLWQCLRPALIQLEACEPRIWLT